MVNEANTRGKERQRRKRDARELDGSRVRTMEAIRAEREELDARIAREEANPVIDPTVGAMLQQRMRENSDELAGHPDNNRVVITDHGSVGKGAEHYFEFTWVATRFIDSHDGGRTVERTCRATVPFPPETIQDLPRNHDEGDVKWARQLFRQGYNVVHVMLSTRCGIDWLSDFDIDEEGYYIVPDDN